MDPITHGITGALIGKAFFVEGGETAPPGSAQERVPAPPARAAVVAATLSALFPDIDIFFNPVARNELASLEFHRGPTHSIVCLPFFALGLAALFWWLARRRGWGAPSYKFLWLVCAAGLASHILLDLITSYGTMIWSPLARTRVAWDLVFIIDFLFTAIVLAPQAAAWVYRSRSGRWRRGVIAWGGMTAGGVLGFGTAWLLGVGFTPLAIVVVGAALAALFFLPARNGWGFGVRRASWCRAGAAALAIYLGICTVAHQVALARAEEFADSRALEVKRIGALPMPPSLLHWSGLIRTPEGVYQAPIHLHKPPAAFEFFPDAAANGHTAAALALPNVQTYLWFARFPVMRYREQGEQRIVEFHDLRFYTRARRAAPFVYRVVFDADGQLLHDGWAREPD